MTAMFGLTLLFAGCVHKDSVSGEFSAIAANLEGGGSVYGIFTRRAGIVDGARECLAQLEEFIGQAKYTEEEKNAARSRIADMLLLWHFAGLHDVSGVGISSVPKGGGIFSNRIFVSAAADSAGAFNQLLCRKNEDISRQLAGLPAETFLACGVNISGKNILKLISSSGEFGERFLRVLPQGFPFEVLASIEGWLVFAVARNAVLPPAENDIMLQIPDPEGKLFALAAAVIRQGKVVPMESRLVLPLTDESIYLHEPVVKKADGKLLIYSSAKAEAHFEKPANGSLKDSPEFLRYAKDLRQDGSAFVYSSKVELPGCGFVRDIPLAGYFMPAGDVGCFGVLSSGSSGWLWQEMCGNDLSALIGKAGVYRQISKLVLPQRKRVVPQKRSSLAPAAVVRRQTGDYCTKVLVKLYAELLKFSAGNQNKFPEFAGIKSLKKYFPKFRNPSGGKIFYFGAPSRQADYPLAISCHRKLTDSFCVLYADGKVRTYQLERAGSCRRIISFLYTVHRWEVKLFQHLIAQAQQLDEESAKKE